MSRWRLTVTLPRRRKPEVDLIFPSYERAMAAAEELAEEVVPDPHDKR